METHLLELLRSVLALLLGALVGLGFGLLQRAAQRRHEQLQAGGKLNSGWSLMPGSAGRVAYLLVALALVQLVSPALFAGAGAWWVSAGVVLGYGAVLFRQLQQRRADLGLIPIRTK